ncbi:asparagine synthase (glutamine-hydrolyzing) [Aliarcobacter butzleri]|uniref:asparagine synthase (glutamine-hydrolyzing) n=1 Tax=Aliarcobacter butzleri TaxID=28197 RepID=A0AAP4UZE2_9BACT|nr:asparagine synthase (glutamine-hydrolyzing) [Aliarcobacter butzleri]MDN5053001.1 asparagine synthase (glutamine-hydrolyzing) [Aliarcobacter butzleri]MDN5076015.1 asparagine synthase (glutamine-hydrolyzing) [Aliarcobacter butzleri]MDN5117378.1 asparagine synthase (glutamine-hydrolyzing) [Aliarcobacter butzleri]MDN5133248.1 asparagine synthase (glutamine-hydrolyzing) [Aliarcobacter butzleri]NUW26520.1 asparagine synthase (glutamine-hydrolyzing) [Aliarcobacter butzleri]
MCGIVGFIDKNKNVNIINYMLKMQSYRGPDDSGVYYDDKSGVHFGHNRLSIQDLSSHGHQPFVSDCENYIIVFNGEVYNFKAIRTELENLGYKFISNSDTEVMLYSYKEWGIKCIDKFVGMFAFAILDKVEDKLVLVRDRAGVKPLYYYADEKEFMFSSEIKSFHKHPKFKKEQNLEVLPYFFQFGYIPAPFTIFQNCFKLEAGHYLELKIDSLEFKITKYWDVNDYYLQEKFTKSEDEILEDIEKILDDAIDLRMVSDVPVGVFLSGGYDSSLVASILAKKQGKKINTFTIGFDDEKYNEAKHAKTIAEYLGTNHTEYYMRNSDMLDLVESLPFYYDEPFGDSSALPTMIVSKLARQSVTVALSSDGGDEAFCGYSKYFFLNKFQDIFSNSFKREVLKVGLNLFSENSVEYINKKLPKNLKQTNIKDKYTKFQRAINSSSLEQMFENASSYVDKNEIARFLKVNQNQELFKKWEKIGSIEFLNQMMAVDYKLFMNDDVLTKVDRATMSVSLEGREPLLDHRIIEYMTRVPLDIKYKNKQGKYLLRQVLYKYLPKEMVDKPKSGFQIPLNEWLRGELKPLVLKYLDNSRLDENIFDIGEIERIKKRFFDGVDIGTTIWFILMYQMWKEKWLE